MAQPRVVTIHYTLTNDQGEELASSRVEGREPLSYLEGAQNIIGGLDISGLTPDGMLLCVTEMNTRQDIEDLTAVLSEFSGMSNGGGVT